MLAFKTRSDTFSVRFDLPLHCIQVLNYLISNKFTKKSAMWASFYTRKNTVGFFFLHLVTRTALQPFNLKFLLTRYLESFLLHHTTGTVTVKSQNSSDILTLDDFPKCSNIHRFPRTALKSSIPLKVARSKCSDMQLLQSRFQASKPHSSQLFRRVRCHQMPVTSYWQSLMAPLTKSPSAGLVSCITRELENHQPHRLHQPSFWFRAVPGQPRSHLTAPAANTPACPQPGQLP